MDVYVTTFRFMDKSGTGRSKTFYRYLPVREMRVEEGLFRKKPMKRAFRARILNQWKSAEDRFFYRAQATDPYLIKYLAKNADPDNSEIYFGHDSIYDRA